MGGAGELTIRARLSQHKYIIVRERIVFVLLKDTLGPLIYIIFKKRGEHSPAPLLTSLLTQRM